MQHGGWRLLLASACSVLLLLGAMPPAVAAEDFEFLEAFGPDGTEAGGFSKASAVAVDQQERRVYVLDREAGELFKFDLEGNPVAFGGSSPNLVGNKMTGLAVLGGRGERPLAVDSESHTIYVTGAAESSGFLTALEAYGADGEPAPFTAGPAPGTNQITGFNGIEGIAVDSTGAIYASTFNSSEIFVYQRSGAPITHFEPPLTGAAGLGVSSRGALYVVRNDLELRRFTPSAFPVTPTTTYTGDLNPIDPNHPFGVAVAPDTNDVYVVEGSPFNRVSVFDEDGALKFSFAGPGESGELEMPEGIGVHVGEELAFVADNPTGGLSQIRIFRRSVFVGPPTVEVTAAANVTADTASLRTRINPNTLETTFWFEYGQADCEVEGCTRVPLNGQAIGDGHEGVSVSREISGLDAETLYHYRVVAENEDGLTEGPSKTFVTQAAGLGFSLSDSRVWEMVSPSEKQGGLLALPSVGVVQAAESGNALAYLTLGSIESDPAGNRAIEVSSVLAHRGSDEWRSRDITPPHDEVTQARDAEYKSMTPDLARSLLEARDATPLSPLTTERTPYVRENTEPPFYAPLLTSAVGQANVPPGTEFDQVGLDIVGASADLGSIALRSPAPLTLDAGPGGLYLWRDGAVWAVSELPANEGGGVVSASLGSNLGSVRNAVSDDGSRVFWMPGNAYGGGALYLRDIATAESVRLDVVKSGGGGGTPDPVFQGASIDGAFVFLTDSHRLTAGSSPKGHDLYRCEIPLEQGLGGCANLVDVSAPPTGAGVSANVKDQVVALSDDGKRAYFVAEGILDTGLNAQGDGALAEQPNLYLWEESAGVRFIATLADGDSANWGEAAGVARGYSGFIAADASPSGRYLALVSGRALTGYDNGEEDNGEPAQEAFRYDAATDELTCVSCNPTGASPKAKLMPPGTNPKVDALGLWGNRWVSALLPQARTEGFGDTLYRPRAALDNGRVYFNAYDSLVPADSNGGWDVYQYESIGTGSCAAGSGGAAASHLGGGCVSLLSSGTGDQEAAFLDASPTGEDVFFLSPAELSVLDVDDVYDVYDARVDGVEAQLPLQTGCAGEACQPALAPPIVPTPSSESFRGRETPLICRRGHRKVRRNGQPACVRKKKHKKPHRRKKAGDSRRAAR